MKTNRTMAVLSSGALLISAASALGQDWPQWRGANRDAKASGFTAPKTWPKELTQKWKVTVGQSDATPVLVSDKLYVFSRQEGKEIVRCLDAATGKELWKDDYDALPADGPASPHPGPRSSPTVANGKVVTLGVRGMLSCLDATTGKQLWRKDDFQGARPRFYTASSPLVVDGLCIAQLGGQNNGAMIAYDLGSGDEKWKWANEGPGYASPVLMTVGGTKVVVAQTDKNIVAINAANGKPMWQAPFAGQGMSYNTSTCLVDGDTLIYCGPGRPIKAVKMEKQGDVLVAKDLWNNADSSVQFNTPILKSGLIFGISQGNQFFCLKADNGQTAWTAPVGQTPPAGGGGGGRGGRGGGFGSIVDAGSVLLALTPAAELIVLEPSEKQFTEIARIKVADAPTYAYPVVSGNRIFIEDQNSVTLWTVN